MMTVRERENFYCLSLLYFISFCLYSFHHHHHHHHHIQYLNWWLGCDWWPQRLVTVWLVAAQTGNCWTGGKKWPKLVKLNDNMKILRNKMMMAVRERERDFIVIFLIIALFCHLLSLFFSLSYHLISKLPSYGTCFFLDSFVTDL